MRTVMNTPEEPPKTVAPQPEGFVWRPVHIVAIGLGAGLMPKAPGTAGTLVGVLLYVSFRPMTLAEYLAIVAGLFAAGIWVCGRTAQALGRHDHPWIVWDEIVGFLITMIAAPTGWPWVILGFVLFRLFDIWKPWPIRWLDRRVGGGLGIMLDDAIAGIYGLLVIQLSSHFLQS